MEALQAIRERLPDEARDLKINLSNVLVESALTPAQAWGVALAAAYAVGDRALVGAIAHDAGDKLDDKARTDARAAAVLMAMNNVYYRSRHMLHKESYEKMPARLRMTRIATPASSKLDFELYCIAVSAINGCEVCLRSHERVVTEGGVSEGAVHDVLRIAGTIAGVAAGLSLV